MREARSLRRGWSISTRTSSGAPTGAPKPTRSPRTGVTTWLDAGSACAYSFPGFRRYVAEASRARILGLLNLSLIGFVVPAWEFATLDHCDVDLAARITEETAT